jgi:hypothetical protein
MACEHKGGPELIEMAEERLAAQGVPRERWAGRRFRWAENVEGVWKSVITEVERRGEEWVVVRLDRSPAELPEGELGFREVAGS